MSITGSQPPSKSRSDKPPRARQWLSHGFEDLLAQCLTDGPRPRFDFDVVIVGSGYGGAIAAATLAERFSRVCVLERGNEYLPGAFPSRMADLAGHVRFSPVKATTARGNRDGLFDVRIGEDVCALVANGLGGGSLINAGVMEALHPSVLANSDWPSNLGKDTAFINGIGDYGHLALRLGAAVRTPTGTERNTVARSKELRDLPKLQVLKTLGGAHAKRDAAVTIGMVDGDSTSAGVALNPCIGCGDCATGCNHGAKNSLDCNLLVQARHAGTTIYTGATVLRLMREDKAGVDRGWVLVVNHTDAKLRERQPEALCLRARRVVLAAGTFGSTEILMRSRTRDLQFSPKLGQRFSTNGDMISVAYALNQPVHCAAGGNPPKSGPVGPTITGLIDLRNDKDADDPDHLSLVIEDISVPGPLRTLFDETVTTAATLHELAHGDDATHRRADASRRIDPCAVNPDAIERSLLVAMMWRDSAEGQLTLSGGDQLGSGDGALHVHWPALREAPQLAAAERRLDTMREKAGLRGRVMSNPLWRLLPDDLEFVFGKQRGPLLTVHPLGGCPMGDDAAHGVVDDLGRVFDAVQPGELHDGLLVLDGSIIPTSLGINPSLTIAALTQRAIDRLLAGDPTWAAQRAQRLVPPTAVFERPVFWSKRPSAAPPPPRATTMQMVERMCGVLPLRGYGLRFVELTLRFEPTDLRELIGPKGPRMLKVGPRDGKKTSFGELRVFNLVNVPQYLRKRFGDVTSGPYKVAVPKINEEIDSLFKELKSEDADWVGQVSGTLELFRHDDTTPVGRRLNALPAWWLNRGMRDTFQYLADSPLFGKPPRIDGDAGFGRRLLNAWQLASRAGEVRLLEYALHIDQVEAHRLDASEVERWNGRTVRGSKRLTYECAGNPWRQLMELTIDEFPQLDKTADSRPLQLDLHYLARLGVPLMRVADQEDQPNALVDLASFGLYLLRMLLNVHIWSFRKPDSAEPRIIDRLPGAVAGLPPPQIEELVVGERNGRAVHARLTRYAQPAGVDDHPVLMIHGYSASGTTFAHGAVRPNLAEYLHRRGRDVWIVDMRTSAGMPTAREPWTFEEVARADIPVVVRHVQRVTRAKKIDIVAHCMGAAMLSMALLGEKVQGDETQPGEPHWDKRKGLHDALRHVVMSQVGPAVMFSPTNVLRAFVMRYARHYLGIEHFQFRAPAHPGVADQMLDRLLATMPYPKEEFRIENPLAFWRRTPWTATRHRMDALYGRDFSLVNATQAFLDRIDDHFGPLSIDTVSQAIHFARFNTITDRAGFNAFVSPRQLDAHFTFDLLSIHGVDNGLTDITTLDHMQSALFKVVRKGHFKALPIEGHGHQDCLIGKDAAARVFAPIEKFLKHGHREAANPGTQRGGRP